MRRHFIETSSSGCTPAVRGLTNLWLMGRRPSILVGNFPNLLLAWNDVVSRHLPEGQREPLFNE
jgi:hypothetical protein